MTITGPGANLLTISGNNASRVFDIAAGVSISGLTISGGLAPNSSNNGWGGGIYNGGSLTLTDSTVSGNAINGTSQNVFGGGIFNAGTMIIDSSTIAGNTAAASGGFFGDGAGLGNSGTLNVVNSTVVGNITNFGGGALFNGSGTTTFNDSTISGNQDVSEGGIWVYGGTVDLQNTIVAKNMDSSGESDINSPAGTVNGSFNLVGVDTNLSGISNGSNGNQIGTAAAPLDPLLGPLADNGGPTPTMALLPDSPARGAGTTAGAPAADQRGLPRLVNGLTDIGAYEVQVATVANLNDSGPGSLRQAILDANPGDDIDFAPNLTGTLTLTSGVLNVNQSVNIFGPASGDVTITSGGNGRIFNIDNLVPGPNIDVSITNLTVAGASDSSGSGGAILSVAANLALTDDVFSDNSETGVNGGVIEYVGGSGVSTLTITDSTFEDNSAPGNGGAIDSPGLNLVITGSTFEGNSAADGGALSIGDGTVTITNSTFSGNQASDSGGAINSNFGATFTLLNDTIAGNNAGNVAGGVNAASSGPVIVQNTIIAGNTAGTFDNDVAGNFVSSGNNLIGDVGDTSSFGVSGDQTGGGEGSPLDPLLGPLADNGGPTETIALLIGSPAIDGANTAAAPATDQRGVHRPAGSAADIGAYEATQNAFLVTTTADSGPGSLRQAILDSNSNPNLSGGPNVIQFDIPGSGVQTIAPLSLLPIIMDAVFIDGYSQPDATPNTLPSGDNAILLIQIDGAPRCQRSWLWNSPGETPSFRD